MFLLWMAMLRLLLPVKLTLVAMLRCRARVMLCSRRTRVCMVPVSSLGVGRMGGQQLLLLLALVMLTAMMRSWMMSPGVGRMREVQLLLLLVMVMLMAMLRSWMRSERCFQKIGLLQISLVPAVSTSKVA